MAYPFEFVEGGPLERALPAIRWLKIGAYAPSSMRVSRTELLYAKPLYVNHGGCGCKFVLDIVLSCLAPCCGGV